jgi:hypothetical protein
MKPANSNPSKLRPYQRTKSGLSTSARKLRKFSFSSPFVSENTPLLIVPSQLCIGGWPPKPPSRKPFIQRGIKLLASNSKFVGIGSEVEKISSRDDSQAHCMRLSQRETAMSGLAVDDYTQNHGENLTKQFEDFVS